MSSKQQSSSKKSSTGIKGLMAAVAARDLATVKSLIKQGTDINGSDDGGWTPLRKAARLGDMSIVSMLLENGAKVTDADKIVVLTAASWGRTEVLRQLLESNGKVDQASEWEVSPLVSATRHGHLRAVKVLIEYGANLNQLDRQGNDPLMVAWESNCPDIVFYMVEKGANLKNQEDWLQLAEAPETAKQISEGIRKRQRTIVQIAEEAGTATMDTYKTDVRIPLEALCRWLEMVPEAALSLLDNVLFLKPKDTPRNVDLAKKAMRTAYLTRNEWVPKEEPKLRILCPTDTATGHAVPVCTKVLHQEGIISTQYLFSLTLSTPEICTATSNQALLHHLWVNFVRRRFFMDVAIEVLGSSLLLVWWILSSIDASDLLYDDRSTETAILYAACAVILCITVSEILSSIRLVHFYKANGYMAQFKLQNHYLTYLAIFLNLLWLAMVATSQMGDLEEDVLLTPTLKASYIVKSGVIAFRWLKIASFLQACEGSGPKLIPILRSFTSIAPYILVAFVATTACAHATGTLGSYLGKHSEGVEALWDLFFMYFQIGQLKFTDMQRLMFAYDTHHIQYIVVAIFIVFSLSVSLALGNVLIALLDEQFDFENEKGFSQFLRYRVKLSCGYLFGIMSPTVMMAPGEKLLQVVFPNFFQQPQPNGYLWACYIVDTAQDNDQFFQDDYQGRLGFVKHSAHKLMESKYIELHDRIQDMQMRLNKEVKFSQSYLRKTSEELLNRFAGSNGGKAKDFKNRLTKHEECDSSSGVDDDESVES